MFACGIDAASSKLADRRGTFSTFSAAACQMSPGQWVLRTHSFASFLGPCLASHGRVRPEAGDPLWLARQWRALAGYAQEVLNVDSESRTTKSWRWRQQLLVTPTAPLHLGYEGTANPSSRKPIAVNLVTSGF